MTSRPLVLDASAAVGFLALEPQGQRVERHLREHGAPDGDILVPPFFWLEVINALAGGRKWTGAQVLRAIAELDVFEVATSEQDRGLVLLTLDLVERHRLVAYDAAYLALAIQLDAQLMTLDRRLAAAAGPRAIPLEDGNRLAETAPTYDRDVTWPDYRGASAFLAKLRADALQGGGAKRNDARGVR